MIKQIFTFGFSHKHPNCYRVIWAESKGACRDQMFEEFGAKWAFQYDSEKDAGVEEFNLKEVKTKKK